MVMHASLHPTCFLAGVIDDGSLLGSAHKPD